MTEPNWLEEFRAKFDAVTDRYDLPEAGYLDISELSDTDIKLVIKLCNDLLIALCDDLPIELYDRLAIAKGKRRNARFELRAAKERNQ